MSTWLIVFEDAEWRRLRPLTDLTTVPDLTFGASTLGTRWARAVDAELLSVEARGLGQRRFEGPSARPQDGDDVLIVNAAALHGPWFAALESDRSPGLYRTGERIAAARAPLGTIVDGLGRGDRFEVHLASLGLPEQAIEAEMIEYPWHLIERNADAITADLANIKGAILGDVHAQAAVLASEHVTVQSGARVDPFAVLDGRKGPVWIGEGAKVNADTLVQGPCVVGEKTELLGGFIENTTFGPQCRIAGEVADCIWQGYGNKRHHGFVGHSMVGEWVNLGAMTTTSDLKNNYGSVRVWIDGEELDSGSTKVGSLIGAHVKTGIGTLLTTGCTVGSGSNLFGGGRFAPKHVASFAWWNGETLVEHRLDAFLKTARIAMGRRDRTLGPDLEEALRRLFEATAGERRSPQPAG